MRELTMDEMEVVSGGKFYWDPAIADPEIVVTASRFNWNDWAIWLDGEAQRYDNLATDIGIIGGLLTFAAAAELGVNVPLDLAAVAVDAAALGALMMSRVNAKTADAIRHMH